MKKSMQILLVAFYAVVAFVLPNEVTVFDKAGMTSLSTKVQDKSVDNIDGIGPTQNN